MIRGTGGEESDSGRACCPLSARCRQEEEAPEGETEGVWGGLGGEDTG